MFIVSVGKRERRYHGIGNSRVGASTPVGALLPEGWSLNPCGSTSTGSAGFPAVPEMKKGYGTIY